MARRARNGNLAAPAAYHAEALEAPWRWDCRYHFRHMSDKQLHRSHPRLDMRNKSPMMDELALPPNRYDIQQRLEAFGAILLRFLTDGKTMGTSAGAQCLRQAWDRYMASRMPPR